ncbi:MBL fold metallo-hydrolase [Tundrisphaera lichenicola]|uniref:MBL fold metallo-hydrolase n=1 Tax=Tundrisphaera lichenicola TaxID=2029860 RepID=UPI003EBEE0C6
MPDVRLIPLGVGDAFSALRYTTCYALGVDDAWLLIDCPHPVRKMWHEATLSALGEALDLDRIVGVAITHLHADHASGLEDFAYYTHFGLKQRATWLAHPDVSARLWDGLLSAGMGRMRLTPNGVSKRKRLEEYVDMISLDASRPVEFGPFSIECRPTIHSIPTSAFRIRAAGRTFAFSADTAHDPSLIEWLAPADLIVHEATTLDQSPVHTPYARLAELPEALRSKMRLTHLPDGFDAGTSLIEPIVQGRLYRV